MDVSDRLQRALPFIRSEKAPPEPFLDRAARWATELTYRDVPKPVRRSAAVQLTNGVAAVIRTGPHPIGDRIRRTVGVDDEEGRATLFAGGQTGPERAALGNAALASVFGIDDVILGGAVGRSSVFVPLAYAESVGANGRRLLVAQVAANEIAGRLGAAIATDPFDDERNASIHAVGAAVGRGLIEGIERDVLADALGTAIAQPPSPLERSLVGSEAGVWSASDSIRSGIAAVDSAWSGIGGGHDLIEGDGGFLETVCERPSPAYLSGLGERWHTSTLTVTQFPGGVFLAAPIEAAMEARGRFGRGRTAVRGVDVYVPAVSIEADARTERYSEEDSTRPARRWSIPDVVATTLVDGQPTPERLTDRANRTRTIAERVRVHQDAAFTVAAAESAGQSGVTLGGVDRIAPFRAARALGPKSTVRYLPSVLRSGRERSPPPTFEGAERRFGARIVVTTASGRTIERRVDRPSGFAGAPLAEKRAVARTKFRNEMKRLGIDEAAARRRSRTLLAIGETDSVSLGFLSDPTERE